ncbi:ribonuclease H-like domain-containing protein, partial [Phlyctochytrium arcticum]
MPKGAARGGNEGGIDVEDFDGFQSSLFSALAQLARASQPLKPADLSFYKSLSPTFTQRLQSSSDKLLGVCNRVFNHAAAAGTSSSSTKEAANFQDSDDLVDDFDLVVDVVDSLLEKADTCMDEVTGRIKKNAPDSVPGQSAPVMLQVSAGGPGSAKGGKSSFNVVAAQNIVRPQLRFEDKVDNSNRPHERKITFKPNAKVPLETATQSMSDKPSAELIDLPHAYEHEIRTIEYPESMFKIRPEQLYASMDQTPCTWVDTEEKLLQMATLLDSAEEIAIDTEHHDYRSFQGFVCLIQVSTRNEDFLIDALALRNHLHVLNSCFTNPNIVKVLHGAEMDIVWLQKDFGLYIVNLFDTYHASHMLEMSQHGLAFLLKYYCSVETNKAYQLADWRIRPLPTEMLKYARSDTHYLLYVYDRMRNELLTLSNPETHNLMHATLERSQQTSLNKYEKDVYDLENGHGPNGWRNALRKFGGTLSAKQFAVFRAIHAWRDHTAREEDESQRYVLPNHMLYTLADRMPIDAQGVLGCCHPVPPLVRLHATDIAIIIDNTLVEVTRAKETME